MYCALYLAKASDIRCSCLVFLFADFKKMKKESIPLSRSLSKVFKDGVLV